MSRNQAASPPISVASESDVSSADGALEMQFRALLEEIPVGIFVTRGEKVVFANEAAASLLGARSSGDLLGHALETFVLAEDRHHYVNLIGRLSGGVEKLELSHIRYRNAEGSPIYAESSARTMDWQGGAAVLVTVRDVTAQKAVERALREREQRIRAIVENVADAVITMDVSGRMESVNSTAERMFGYGADEMIGESVAVIVGGEGAATHDHDVSVYLATGQERVVGMGPREAMARHKDGSEFPVSIAISEVNTDGNRFFIGAIRDISMQRQMEEMVRTNRAKSEFLATMSHEIRTPLNGIMGMVQLILGTDLTEKQQKYIQMLRKSGGVLLTLVNEILDISKLKAGRLEIEAVSFDIRETIGNIVDVVTTKANEKNITLSLHVDSATPAEAVGDPGKLQQVLLNFMGNAIKFSEGGTVALWVRPANGGDDPFRVRFDVIDTGIGIAPEVVPRMFERFTQADSSTSRKYGGTGLGLAICKQFIELMGGEIGVESEPGRGSTFSVTLPFSAPEPESEKTAGDGVDLEDLTVRPMRILLAEDNDINQLFMTAILEKAGHEVDAVANGELAVSAAKVGGYDLVLMDIHMPDMDGIEATQAIRSSKGDFANVPIIALTANSMKGDRERFLAAGMSDYVSKPIDMDRFSDAVARTTGISSGLVEAGLAKPRAKPEKEITAEAEAAFDDLFGTLDELGSADE